MGESNLIQSSFLGGEWSFTAQGRIDIPQYRTAMNVCSNAFPTVTGAWTTRSGTNGMDPTRLGLPARTIKFDFNQATPYNLEFTDGWLRFRSPYVLSTTNDSVAVSAISSANPAVVQTASATGWATGNSVFFTALGANNPRLQQRRFLITVVDGTHFSLADEITGLGIDGSTIGAFVSGIVNRVQEVVSPYSGGSWAGIRVIQAEATAVIVGGNLAPQYLTVTTPPVAGASGAIFALNQPVFLDGPYLDPFTNGAQATPGGLSGNVTLTISFQAYSSTVAYAKGAFVVSSSINYVSLVDNNVNNTPASSPSDWATTAAGAAINNGQGWLGTDVGRLVRLYSEPALWAKGTTYATGNIVTYNPSGLPGANQYWTSLTNSNTGNIPGNDATHWAIATNASLWSWGKITGLTTQISQTLSGVANIGNMVADGGLAAAFDGNTNQKFSACAARANNTGNYVGRNYSGASAQAIGSVTIYPSNDLGFDAGGTTTGFLVTINLRAKSTLPANSADGTLLGTTGPIQNQLSAVSITSNDQVTTWNYVWIELIFSGQGSSVGGAVAEFQQFSPAGTGTGSAVDIEILGPPLLYTVPIVTWRLGVFSNTTGWPTCGTYHEGRLWLSGVVSNRFDAGVAGGGNVFNFAPTQQDGSVTAANALSYILLGPNVNPIFWMAPDQQGILCGTQAGEWLVQATTLNSPLSPLNIQAHQTTSIGCYNNEPRRTEHTLVFIQRYRRRLMEYFADVFSGKFSAPDLSEFSKHIIKKNALEIAYQQDVTPVIWVRLGDGTFAGVTYKRDSLASSQGPNYAGWHRHTLGSGRTLTSISSGPSSGGNLDALSMVTYDAVTGLYYYEQLQDQFVENVDDITEGWFLDSATQAASYGVSGTTFTASGFYYLAGRTVRLTAGGLDLGNVTIGSDGTAVLTLGATNPLFTSAFVSSFSGSMLVIAGFNYNCQGQIVRPARQEESGTRSGPGFGRKRRASHYLLSLVDTQGLYIGTDFTRLNVVTLTSGTDWTFAMTPLAANIMKTGLQTTTLTDDYSYDSMVCWQVPGPFPATIACLSDILQTQG